MGKGSGTKGQGGLGKADQKKGTQQIEILFKVVAYNIRSFTTDEKLETLMKEFQNQHWDVIVLIETWRETREELWTTRWGHTWCGGGGIVVVSVAGVVVATVWVRVSNVLWAPLRVADARCQPPCICAAARQ